MTSSPERSQRRYVNKRKREHARVVKPASYSTGERVEPAVTLPRVAFLDRRFDWETQA